MVQGLADAETGRAINISFALPHIRYGRHWRAVTKPDAQFRDFLRAPTGKDFDVSVVEIDCIARDAEPQRLSPGTVPEPYALNAPTDPEATRY